MIDSVCPSVRLSVCLNVQWKSLLWYGGIFDDDLLIVNLPMSVPVKEFLTRSPAAAEAADRTAYDALINDYPDNNTLPCSQQHEQNGQMIKKARYNK